MFLPFLCIILVVYSAALKKLVANRKITCFKYQQDDIFYWKIDYYVRKILL